MMMADGGNTSSTVNELSNLWGETVDLMVCESCDWRYVLPQGVLPQRCPNCFNGDLKLLTPGPEIQTVCSRPPESYLPFSVSMERVLQNIQEFASGPWFAPADLNPATLRQRLKRVYWPMWLVDCNVRAAWEAEAGYDYEVVSHQDRYSDSQAGWTSQEIKETRVRWEPRAGRLERSYTNIPAPALEGHRQLVNRVRRFQLEQAQPYSQDALRQAFVRVPDRSVEDAWPDAAPAVQDAAADECRKAANAEHIRQFQWTPDYQNLNWTLLLLPVFTTYYLDDDQKPQQILIHGQNGYLSGVKRASMKRAQKTALYIAIAAMVVFVLSLLVSGIGLVIPPLLAVGGIGIVAAVLLGAGAIMPLAIAWQVNRSAKD
ncbi:MAG TPA: hypothetical protein PKM21_00580 [Anaerolineales bacterium]|nr:hypothetical protein [Anaerolineales bacterium]